MTGEIYLSNDGDREKNNLGIKRERERAEDSNRDLSFE